MPPELSIIIVSYNTRELTLPCLESLYRETTGCSFEVIVLDNQSEDGSAEEIRTRFPQATLLETSHNLGFAGGNNEAAKIAKGQRLLLLNPDTLIFPGAIDNLAAFAQKRPEAKLWGAKTIFPDKSINASVWNDMTLWSTFCRAFAFTYLFPHSRLFNPESIHAWHSLEEELPVDIVVGSFLLIDHDIWKKLGGFNRSYFMYGDEVDLCLRARKLGARPYYTPTATIIHYGGESEPSNEEKLIQVFKGRATVMHQHWTPFAAWLGSNMVIAGVALRAVASRLLHWKSRRPDKPSTSIWAGAFRRRQEWSKGWPIQSPAIQN